MDAERRDLWRRLRAYNRVLIPKTEAERERFRRSAMVRGMAGVLRMLRRLSPEGRWLLGIALLTAIPAGDVRHSHVYVAWAMLVGLLLASVLVSRLFHLRELETAMRLAPRVTVGRQVSLAVRVRNGGSRTIESVRLTGPLFPIGAKWSASEAKLGQLLPGGDAQLELRAIFGKRGVRRLPPLQLNALAPLGLALGPPRQVEVPPFNVVPAIANVSALQMPTGRKHQPGGIARASHTADSRELRGVRPYRFGDSMRNVHARTWARTGKPATREFQEEYFARVGLVLDTEATEREETFEAALSLVAGLASKLGTGESLLDVIVFGDRLHNLTVGRSLGAIDDVLDLLAAVEAGPKLESRAVLGRLSPALSRLSAVLCVSTGWGAEHETLVRSIRMAGTPAVGYVVSEGEAPPSTDARWVAADRIRSGEPILL
jgi:uncharacterized protein (DUF58 family)